MNRFGRFLALLCLLLSPLAYGQNTVTVTADVKSIFAANPGDTKTKMCLSLVDGANNPVANPLVSGVGFLVQDKNVCVTPTAGHFSTTVYANDVISVNGVTGTTMYNVTFLLNNQYVKGDTYVFNVADGTENLNTKAGLSTAPVVTPPAGDSVYARLNFSNGPFTAAIQAPGATFTGNITAGSNSLTAGAGMFSRLFKRCFVDGNVYTTLNAAYTDTTNCNDIYLPPNYTETQTAALYHFTRSNVNVHCMGGTCVITNTAGWKVDAGTQHASFDGGIPWPMTASGGNAGGLTFAGYTGSGIAFQVGDGTADSGAITLKNVHVDLSVAAAGAESLKVFRTNNFINIDNFATLLGADSQTGIDCDGTGNFTGFVHITNPWIASGASGTNATGIRSGPLCNAFEVSGGDITLIQAGTSRGLVADGGEMWLDFPNVNTAATGVVTLKNGTNNGRIAGDVRMDSGVTNGANFGNGTLGSHVYCANCVASLPVTDTGGASNNGTNSFNSFYTPDSFWLNDQKWSIAGPSNGNFVIKDMVNSKSPIQIVPNGNLFLGNGTTPATIDNGSRLYLPEASAGAGAASQTLLQSNSITHRLTMNNNNTGVVMITGTDGATAQKSETAADTSVLSFTPPAVAGTYRIIFVLSLSAANAATLGWTATWTDSNGNAQTPTNLSLYQSGTAAPALTFTTSAAGNYYGDAVVDVNSSATAIVVKLTFSGTSFTGKVSATIERLQ